jgi:hypothetical protein
MMKQTVTITDLIREAIEALEVLALDADEAGYFVRAEAATDLAFRLRCALAKDCDVEVEEKK